MRCTSGSLEDLASSSTLAAVMPFSSAAICPKAIHLTMSNHWSSPCRTAGASGSLEMVSGSTMKSAGLLATARVEARSERSVVGTSHRPEKKALRHSSALSNTTGRNFMLWVRKKSAMLSSIVVPGWMQTAAPSSCLALVTPSFFGTMRPWPS